MKENKKSMVVSLALVCIILSYSICVQIKTIKNINLTVAETNTDNDLRNQVLKWREKYENKYREFEDTEKKLKKIRETSTKDNESAVRYRTRNKK
ncbi:MAG: hypothetical protein Q4G05_01135 [Clostridia bacterium]|nr:hypothetical protein [Clostridia bacterium]